MNTPLRACSVLVAALSLSALATAQEKFQVDVPQSTLNEYELRIRNLENALGQRGDQQVANDSSGFDVGYDKGFYLRSDDSPFSLKINGRMQFRYTGFDRDSRTYNNLGTAAAGMALPIASRNDFEIERARLSFAGTAFDEDLHFYINFDADTDDNHRAIFHDFWFNYEFSDAFNLYIGKAFVPGSREWLGGSTSTFLIDRSMATTFFRPDRTVGVWAIGEPLENFHYHAMVGNGFQTTDLKHNQVNDGLLTAVSLWFEPGGKFGKGYADLKKEDHLRTRFGTSFTHSGQDGVTPGGAPLPESNFLRLDDGTRLTNLGVTQFDMTLLAFDAAAKVSGFSLNSEFYFRWLDNIGPIMPPPGGFPFMSNESWGGYVGAGFMVIPEQFDVQVRTSTVQGDFKDSWEYAAGVNYYINGAHGNKLSLDLTHLDGSPTSNSGPNFRMGDDGWMVRLQVQLSF